MTEEENGIGMLNEHALHLALKNYFDGDESHHEVRYKGAVADIKNGNAITEIETHSFSNLKKKLGRFLEEDSVTVVFPIAKKTRFIYVDENGVTEKSGISSKRGKTTDIFRELLKITDYVGNANLTFKILTLEITEYRRETQKGRRRFERVEKYPTAFLGESVLKTAEDFASLVKIPEGDFYAADFCRLNKMPNMYAWYILKSLSSMGILKCDDSKKPFIYKRIDN